MALRIVVTKLEYDSCIEAIREYWCFEYIHAEQEDEK